VRSLEGASLADVGELGAWVRAACETAGSTSVTRRDEGTRRTGRTRAPETSTVPEHQIHTCEVPREALDAMSSEPA